MQIDIIETRELGNRSYIAYDGDAAIVVDPPRDIDRVLDRLDELGTPLVAVADTHIHNDYLSGGLALSRVLNVPYLVAEAEPVRFERAGVADTHEHRYGSLVLRAIATPGHTPHHLAYLVSADDGGAGALFTGGSLLYGAVGRTDLVEGYDAEELAAAQYRSVRRLMTDLPEDTALYPTHGFGSFCASSFAGDGANSGSLAEEARRNPALLAVDEPNFAKRLVAGFTPYPTYYREMSPLNRLGPTAADLSPADAVDAIELARRLAAADWVLDLRPRAEFAADHIAGTIGFELCPQLGTYVGWLAPFAQPLTLLAPSAATVLAAQRQLARIGWDRPAGAAVGNLAAIAGDLPRTSYPVVRFSDLPTDLATLAGTVIDVRRDDELAATGALVGSRHVPMHQLLAGETGLPGGPLWVHCASGFRASIAASLLHRDGHEVVLIDDPFANATEAVR